MDKEQKAQVIEEIAARLNDAEALFAIDYRGISVPQAAELRGKLRDADASFSVVKNRLAKRAAEQAGQEGLQEMLDGPTALTYVRGDVVTAAKAIATFNREHDLLAYKGGFMDGDPLDEDRFKSLARLPALDVMHGQLVGMTASPLTGLVRGLGSMISGLAVALGQIAEQGLVSGEAPEAEAEEEVPAEEEARAEEEAPAEEAPAEEAPAEEAPAEEEVPAAEEPAEEPAAEVEPAEEGGVPEEPAEPPADEPEAAEEASETENDDSPEEGGDDAEASEGSEED